MSLHQLALMIAEVAVVLAAWRIDPAVGVFAGFVGAVATRRAFVEIRWRRLQGKRVPPWMEWQLVGSSIGVVLLIAGSGTLALVLPVLSLAVVQHLGVALAALGTKPVGASGVKAEIPGALLFLGIGALVGLGLALNAIGVLTYYFNPVAPDARRGVRRAWVVVTAWLTIVTLLGGLELLADWLATPVEPTAAVEYRATSLASLFFPIWVGAGAALILLLWCRPRPNSTLPS